MAPLMVTLTHTNALRAVTEQALRSHQRPLAVRTWRHRPLAVETPGDVLLALHPPRSRQVLLPRREAPCTDSMYQARPPRLPYPRDHTRDRVIATDWGWRWPAPTPSPFRVGPRT